MKKISLGIFLRILLILILSFLLAHQVLAKNWFNSIALGFVNILIGYNLFTYVSSLNRKMKRLFEAIKFQDFAITFKADNHLGETFKDLNDELNAVIHSFNHVRAEREASLHFINAIVQQINVGIISYDTTGKIEIANQAAGRLLKIYRLSNLSNIKTQNLLAYEAILSLKAGASQLVKIGENELSFSVTEIQMRGRKIRLVSIHNIRQELQEKELEAWQNLTKVLRHEILNSVTPIVSLAETMRDIVETDLVSNSDKEAEAIQDLKEALSTVQRRGNGIMNFVNAYREFTSIPLPNKRRVKIKALFESLELLFTTKLRTQNIDLEFENTSDFEISIDQEQIEQVLINLIKNAVEAQIFEQKLSIILKAKLVNRRAIIEVIDTGKGIEKEQSEKIFIPFFTTKKIGSGIGLSLSRQILQSHGGTLNYQENKPNGSIFILGF